MIPTYNICMPRLEKYLDSFQKMFIQGEKDLLNVLNINKIQIFTNFLLKQFANDKT